MIGAEMKNRSEDPLRALTAEATDEDLLRLSSFLENLLLSRGVQPSIDSPKGPKPCRMFSVPREIKHLDGNGLTLLTESFQGWVGDARTDRTRTSRRRVWLIFLLLRWSGARLGEVLTLDDLRDFDLKRGAVRFGGEGDAQAREVVLPSFLIEEMEEAFASPDLQSLRGEIFRLDQGFVRKKFSEQESRSGLQRELLNPRVLRHSRAVELLRMGVPIKAVQAVLGHSTPTMTSVYCDFSENDLQRIMHHHIRKETSMKTSARNTFVGEVSSMRKGVILTEVELTTGSGLKVVSVITNESAEKLDVKEGKTVSAVVKAPWVIIVKDPQLEKTSARNRFSGKITKINQGQISAEVIAMLEDGTTMCALVTDESVKNLELNEGQNVWFLFKAFSVILNID
jgi:molybdate transport system regulatory protein